MAHCICHNSGYIWWFCQILTKRAQWHRHSRPLINVCDAGGKVADTITLKRLTVLQTAFNHTQATTPSVMQELDATCFEHEVAKLLMRYQDIKFQDGYTPHVYQHWQCTTLAQQLSPPDEYMHALKKGLSLNAKELHSHWTAITCLKNVTACMSKTEFLGANVDAFSIKWEGASQASPEYTPECMAKAVRWAINNCNLTKKSNSWFFFDILSAEQCKTACLTVFVLPTQASTGYHKWPIRMWSSRAQSAEINSSSKAWTTGKHDKRTQAIQSGTSTSLL